jgi:IS4 transposase
MTVLKAEEKSPYLLRRIEVYNQKREEILVFLNKYLTLGATTVAAIYNERWQIELFFKALNRT